MPRPAPPRPPRTAGRRARLALGLLGLALGGLSPGALATAQPAPGPAAAPGPAPEPIGVLLADASGDGVPDRAGTAVLFAARVTAGTGLLREAPAEVYVQDGSGGLRLWLGPGAPPLRAGDSVRVAGVLRHRAGMAELSAPDVRVVPAPPREPAPLRLYPGSPFGRYEGMLVEVHGHVVSVEQGAAEAVMLVAVGRRIVQVVTHAGRPAPFGFAAFGPGDHVRVRGLLAQNAPFADYDGAYVLAPRHAADVARLGLPPAFYRRSLAGFALLLGLAGAWVLRLRRSVRRRAAQLALSERRYVHLFNAVVDAVVVHEGGALVEANRAARRAFGLGVRGGLAGHEGPVSLVALAAEPAAAAAYLARVREKGEAQDVLALHTADGRTVPFEVATRRLDGHAGEALVSVARDVEARLAYEHALIDAMQASDQARGEAEDAVRLKSSILANMSHEIRTPLTAIIGFADLLVDEAPADLREHAETIHSGGVRLLDTLNSILDFARLDAGQEHLDPEPFCALGHARAVVALVQPLARRKGISLTLEAEAEAVPVHHAPVAFGRILHNLVGNAVKFTDRGGVRVQLHRAPGYFALRVQDTGVGMSEAFLPQLFEAFKQESDGHARAFEGTGLGLAITKRLVDLMGGEVRVWSRKGEGTLFEVALPTQAPARPAAPAASGDGAAHRRAAPPEVSPALQHVGA